MKKKKFIIELEFSYGGKELSVFTKKELDKRFPTRKTISNLTVKKQWK